MNKKYFGTDGIRGKVGSGVINPDFILKLGWAVGRVFSRLNNSSATPKIIIGKDTRISGYMFESALEAGLVAAGVNVALIGPMPTPAIAYLTRTFHCAAGIVISASHNPYYDNGIKFFSSEGKKLPDEIEQAIEEELSLPMEISDSLNLGKVERIEDAAGRYIEYCKSTIPNRFDLNGKKIVVDCAHGATYYVAPRVLSELGADIISIGSSPNGLNINESVGSTNPKKLIETVLSEKADLGIAFDGDGDRLLFVDKNGDTIDGDGLLYVIVKDRLRTKGSCSGVVGTLMTNLGLELALKAHGIPFARAKVGDRYVSELMEEKNWILGGESSGHIICSDVATTGDGLIAALKVLFAIVDSKMELSELISDLQVCPQEMINVRTDKVIDLESDPKIIGAVQSIEEKLNESGRVLLRASGTEPLIRVMVEANDAKVAENLAKELASVVTKIAS